jgi:DNA-directed RNA polymerase specialized sigma24 family protein
MDITQEMMDFIDNLRDKLRGNWKTLTKEELEDITSDTYVDILRYDKDLDGCWKSLLNRMLVNNLRNYVRDRDNRRRLETENSQSIISNTTPTLSKGTGGDPAEYVEGLDTLTRRWRTLSPLLRKIARRTFFGYTETPEKVAHDLGTTVAAVNMARTRIKQHMNGAN